MHKAFFRLLLFNNSYDESKQKDEDFVFNLENELDMDRSK